MPDSSSPGVLVGGCFRIQSELGQGGMARVYRVVDERSGARLALKKLLASDESAAARAMFAHEYHTLAQLDHPHIVRVSDYGLDADGPYYTMELLEGADARTTSKRGLLSVQRACSVLRDVASALALIHSRRLLHRDLSPRNVWCGEDGRAKLLDFGTLMPMGPQSKVAGTPPYVPPEAVHAQPLDARADLYALGALAYYLLTGRNAYPARRLRELRQLWQRRPHAPGVLRPEVPAALSELVMALLSVDPRGRPSSAAEVCERLTILGELPADEARHPVHAFLTTPALVGRDSLRDELRAKLVRTLYGQGSTLAIVGAAGLGRSRMLAAAMLEARLMGAAAVHVAAAGSSSRAYSTLIALAEKLVELSAAPTSLPPEHAGALAAVSPVLREAFGDPPLPDVPQRNRERATAYALEALFDAASAEHACVLAIDDVHWADEASLALLGHIAGGTEARRLLLVVTCEASALTDAPPLLSQLLSGADRLELAPLRLADTRALLSSVFGEVPALEDAAQWLHGLSEGSPESCMHYARYLVDHGIARYEAGHWHLPARLQDLGLPTTLAAVLEERAAALSEDARALGLGLVLARDSTRSAWQPENHVHLEDLPKLLDAERGVDLTARAWAALDALVSAGFAERHDQRYVPNHALVEALLRDSDEPTRRRMHARIADIVEGPRYSDPMLAVRHAQAAGQYERSHQMFLHLADRSTQGGSPWDFASMRISIAATCAQRQLAHFREHGGAVCDGVVLRRSLLVACSVYDWRTAHPGDEQVELLARALGLGHTSDITGREVSEAEAREQLRQCMQGADAERAHLAESARWPKAQDAARELPACALPLSGAYVNSHDLPRARVLARMLAQTRSLSTVHALLADICDISLDRITGRALGDRLVLAAQRLAAALEYPELLRRGGAAVYLQVQTLEDARRGRKRALDLADFLASSAGELTFMAVHGRFVAHAFRGTELAEGFQRQAEIVTIDDVWRRNAYLFVEAELFALLGDLPSLTRTAEAIGALAEIFPGLRPFRAYARGQLHRLQGELEAARRELEAGLELAPAGEHRAYGLLAPAHAEVLLTQGRARDALEAATQVVERVQALGLDPCAEVAALRIQALSLSAAGQHDAARAGVERALDRARELEYGGLPLALLHDAETRCALSRDDLELATRVLIALRALLEHARAPALIRSFEALREELTRRSLGAHLDARSQAGAEGAIVTRISTSQGPRASELRPRRKSRETADLGPRVRSVAASSSPRATRYERAHEALRMLLAAGAWNAGHLLLFGVDGMRLAASIGLPPAGEELIAWARHYLAAELAHTRHSLTPTSHDLPSAPSSAMPVLSQDGLEAIVLSDVANGEPMLVGLALVMATTTTTPPTSAEPVTSEVVGEISRRLLEAGDTIPLAP